MTYKSIEYINHPTNTKSTKAFSSKKNDKIILSKLYNTTMNDSKTYIPNRQPLKPYDALQDKHASFYFNSSGVKKHLKKLRKAIQMEPWSKSQKQYTDSLSHKLSQLQKLPSTNKYKIKPYQQTLKPSSLIKLQKLQHYLADEDRKEQQTTQHQLKTEQASVNSNKVESMQKITKTWKSRTIDHHDDNKEKKITRGASMMQNRTAKDKINFIKIQTGQELERDRSNKSVQIRVLSKKRANNRPKQVHHDEFMSFLKERQQKLLKQDNHPLLQGTKPE